MSLDKTHFQKFMKRYRKAHTKQYGQNKAYPVRYFAVGEYGGKTLRPHYHAIMFNVDINLIEKTWTYGNIHVGQVSEASIGYTLKYMMKPSKIPLHKNDDRNKEFQLMSKGLGENYLTDAIKTWHFSDFFNRMYLPIDGGKKIAMPRYYKLKMYTEEQRMWLGQHFKQMIVEKPELTAEQEIQRFESSQLKLKKSRIYETI